VRIGYPCLNTSVGCSPARTFRLASYSDVRLVETVERNLACTDAILHYNVAHGLLAFRLTSDLVPFASHPVCAYAWQERFRPAFQALGAFARQHRMRVSMHPGQYTLINSPREEVFAASVRDLVYHAEVLDLMGLDATARVQIHVGGVYGDRRRSLDRFVARYRDLPAAVRRRLAIENDDRQYGLADCVRLHEDTGTPVIFDTLHHEANNAGESVGDALALAVRTWDTVAGPPMVDYASQAVGERVGKHAAHIDLADFRRFLVASRPHDPDLMLEIKDKEQSALLALQAAGEDPRLVRAVSD